MLPCSHIYIELHSSSNIELHSSSNRVCAVPLTLPFPSAAVEELPPPEISPTKMTAALLSPPLPPAAPPPPPVPVSVQQPAAAAAAPHLRPPSPTPGVIRLPSGMSIQVRNDGRAAGLRDDGRVRSRVDLVVCRWTEMLACGADCSSLVSAG